MAGRAGRRGIDPEGQCVIALDARDGLDDMLRVVDGSPEPIESRSSSATARWRALLGDRRRARRRSAGAIESSFGQYQNLKRIREMEAEIRERSRRRWTTARSYAAPCGDFARIGRYRRARQEVEARRAGDRARRPARASARRSEAEPGRLALVRRKGGAEPGADPAGARDPRPPRALRRAAAARRGRAAQERARSSASSGRRRPLHVPRDCGATAPRRRGLQSWPSSSAALRRCPS